VRTAQAQIARLQQVLDAAAPLYGRAREIIEVAPLGAAWLRDAFGLSHAIDLVEVYALWGGVPRYWELALDHRSNRDAMETLVLDPQGTLHAEPRRLLLDDLRETAQAASVLALIGRGCNRISEIAARADKPATSLTRPLSRLLDLGLVRREQPFGVSQYSSKKSLYRIHDPFLAFWFRFVEPNRSRLEAGAVKGVLREVEMGIAGHQGEIWEALVRRAIPLLTIEGAQWQPAARWWGAGADKCLLEFDVVSESVDGKALLLGEVKLTVSAAALDRARRELSQKAARLPLAQRYKRVIQKVFPAHGGGGRSDDVIDPNVVLDALK
jgi:hypothetical protein